MQCRVEILDPVGDNADAVKGDVTAQLSITGTSAVTSAVFPGHNGLILW